MRFDSNRPVVWEAVGNPTCTSDSLHQHDWRSSECSHAARLSITDWGADRRSNDVLPWLASGPAARLIAFCASTHSPQADFRVHDGAQAPSRLVHSALF